MADHTRVASVWDLPPGERMQAWVSGIKVMLLNVDGEILAVDEQCTHMRCSLMRGSFKDEIISCPCHLGQR